jgi:3-oxoacyl-[acyl-carrier protein] reductase
MLMRRLEGKVALVTGGSRGIGAAISRRLGKEGATVALTYAHDAEPAERVCDEIHLSDVTAAAYRCDMENPTQIETLFAAVKKAHGRIDILVNNAAVAEMIALEQNDLAQFARFFNTNVRGPFLAIQQAVQQFGSDGGKIINISSAITRNPSGQFSLYAATKAALDAMTRSLAKELGPRNITVHGIAPGLIDTQLSRTGLPDQIFKVTETHTPLRRLGTPDDIAAVVAFLASEDANWLTGEILGATGGL